MLPALIPTGFLLLWVDPARPLPNRMGPLEATRFHNPHTIRAVLTVSGTDLGEIGPHGIGTIGLPAGEHELSWRLPDGTVVHHPPIQIP